MKKIATITFHWATNYGAVLQAWALQKHIENNGGDTEIIDYVPGLVWRLSKLTALKNRNLDFFKKERAIKRFLRAELKLSPRLSSNKALHKKCKNYDTVICGSDQVWNESFTVPPKFDSNCSYFLDFAGEARRIAYAASFGSTKIPENMKVIIRPHLEKFQKMSVRENTGKEILADMGFSATLVSDPTLLLEAKDYEGLLEGKTLPEAPRVFSYVLHGDKNTLDISRTVCEKVGQEGLVREGNCGIYEWLALERNSDFLVTNSFHGTVFALLFHTPFITATIKGSGMNDRIFTLLQAVGLEDRIIESGKNDKIDKLISAPIDWDAVDERIAELRRRSQEFLSDI